MCKESGSDNKMKLVDEISSNVLERMAVPVVLVRPCYNDMGTIGDFEIVYVNKEFTLQVKGAVCCGATYTSIKDKLPKTINWFASGISVIDTGRTFEGEYFVPQTNQWFHLMIQKLDNDLVLFSNNDITAQKIKERHLQFVEMNDQNTGLGNEKTFTDAMERVVEDAEKNNCIAALLLIDIDNLRSINDLSGRKKGDEIINICANCLLRMESKNARAYRIEGDEFALVVTRLESESKMRLICDDLFSKLSSCNVAVSMGVALFPLHGQNAKSLLRDSDLALHYVKNNGKGSYKFFDEKMLDDFMMRTKIQERIFKGLQQNEFMLYYQPQFYLSEHKLRGFEALIRWDDGHNGLTAPLSFIPIAEETNIIQILGEWILETAVETLKNWQDNYSFKGIMSVNVSPAQLKSPLFASNLERIINKYQIKPDTLELEITESVFISDIEKTAQLLAKIKQYGIRLALDDFGTGYSSLRYLANMPINTIKLDKSFIDRLGVSEDLNTDIISSIIPITKKAGLETIAEGVEHSNQIEQLSMMNCNCIQGFLWGKPMPVKRCEVFLSGSGPAVTLFDAG